MPTAGLTHHIVLDDGVTQIGLMGHNGRDATFTGWQRAPMASTSIKTSSGETEYSDLALPYYTFAQENWEGGRGQEMLEDKTRFYDACNVWTKDKDQVILGPCQYMANCKTTALQHYSDNDIGQHSVSVGKNDDAHILGYAVQFTIGASDYTPSTVTLFMCRRGRITVGLSVYIYLDVADSPDMGAPAAATGTISASDVQRDTICGVRCTLTSSVLKAGNKYWLAVVVDSPIPQVAFNPTYYEVSGSDGGVTKKTADTLTWVDLDTGEYGNLWYLFDDGNASLGDSGYTVSKFIEYKDCLYAIVNRANMSVPGKLYRNGDRGACDSNASDLSQLIDATKSGVWTENEWAGCTALVIAGGSRWTRKIVANTATGILTVSPDWPAAHTTADNYVIIGSAKWTDVTPTSGDTIDTGIPDAEVSGEYLCLCQAYWHVILMYREYNNAGTWTVWTQDNIKGAKAELLCPQFANKQLRMYRVFTDDGENWQFSYSIKEYVDFADASVPPALKLFRRRPTALMIYGSIPYIFTDSAIFTYYKDTLESLDVNYSSMRYQYNGVNATSWNMFIFFPLMHGLFRTNGKQTDSIGPNRDAGLPTNRNGRISAICPTVDALYYAIDAGTGRSAVMVYNNFGHHEVARGICNGASIRALYYQVIDGGPNILWYAEGTTIRYIKMPYLVTNPFFDPDIVLVRQGELVTSWVDLSLAVADKFWHELTLFSENLSSTDYIIAYYQLDDADDASEWQYIATFTTSPVQTASISSGDTVSGRRIRFKFVIYQVANAYTQADGMFIRHLKLKAWALNAVSRLQAKYSYSTPVIISDAVETMTGAMDKTGAAAIIAQLDTWANNATPLTMTSVDSSATNKKVFVEPLEYRINRYEQTAKNDDIPIYMSVLKLIEA